MDGERHILVADPEPRWREEILSSLEQPGVRLEAVATGAEALAISQAGAPDLLVTELVLPDMTGLGLCRTIRESGTIGRVGVLMVSGHCTEIDRVLAFECGVDDFLAKPFFARELSSRAAAVLRRLVPPARGASDDAPVLASGPVSIQPASAAAVVAGRRLDLTPRELEILALLVAESGRVLTRKQLIDRIWGAESEHTERVVDAHVKSIRRKLGDARDSLETVRGVGYRFTEPAAFG